MTEPKLLKMKLIEKAIFYLKTIAKKPISGKKLGFRDVYWCSLHNDPVIIAYRLGGKQAYCERCSLDIEDGENHYFLFHVNKPY